VGTVILTLAAVYLGKLVVLNFMVGTKWAYFKRYSYVFSSWKIINMMKTDI